MRGTENGRSTAEWDLGLESLHRRGGAEAQSELCVHRVNLRRGQGTSTTPSALCGASSPIFMKLPYDNTNKPKPFSAVAAWLLSAALLSLSQAQAADSPLRLLWLGSSSMYYHSQPKVLAEWLTEHAATPARSTIAGRSGTGVHVYLRESFKPEYGVQPGQTMPEKIAQEKPHFLILQIPAEFIAGPEGEEHDRSLDVYCRASRAAGGEPVFYEMGWGRDEKAELGRKMIFAAAQRNRVTHFAPCSSTWKRVREEHPDLELHNPPDKAHPGTLGLYLNLCCFYATLTGHTPVGLTNEVKVWPHLSDWEKKMLARKIGASMFDEYSINLPDWMKKYVMAEQSRTIEPHTATYLQQVAWEEYQSFQKRLKETFAHETQNK